MNDREELDEGWYQNLRGYFNKDSKYRLPYSEYEDDYETRCHNDPRCRELKRAAVRNSDLEEGNDLMQALDKHPPVYAPGIREEKDSDELDEALLPKNVKPGQLHQTLGVNKSKDITDLGKDTIVNKAKAAINQGKVSYATMIRRLNYQAVLNKNNESGSKLRSVVDALRKWHENKEK